MQALALYAVITLVSTAFSPDPRVSLMADKQMILFLLVPLVYRFATGSHASTMVRSSSTGGGLAASRGCSRRCSDRR